MAREFGTQRKGFAISAAPEEFHKWRQQLGPSVLVLLTDSVHGIAVLDEL